MQTLEAEAPSRADAGGIGVELGLIRSFPIHRRVDS
jgi:hypothetical protein